MKLSQFCWGIELKGAVNFLAIYGLVMSVIGAMVAAFLFFLPLIQRSGASVDIYAGATFLLLVKLGLFVFSYKLHQKNNAEDVTGVKKMIKIGSYIIGSVQVGIFAILFIFGIILTIIGSGYTVVFGGIMTPIGGLFLIFPSLLLHGIRTKHSGKVKAWIIFKCVILGLILAVWIVNSFLTGEVLLIILSALFYTLTILYSSAMVIVHYNILLDDENLLGSALNNFSKEKNIADDQKKMPEDPPAYSQVA